MIKGISKNLSFQELGEHRLLKGQAKERELVQGTGLLRPQFSTFLPGVRGTWGFTPSRWDGEEAR